MSEKQIQITSDTGQWGRIPLWLLETGVSAGAIQLFALMDAKWADRTTKECFPSRQTMATALKTSPASISRWLNDLISVGALEKTAQQRDDGSQSSNNYRLNLSTPLLKFEQGGVVAGEHPLTITNTNQGYAPSVPSDSNESSVTIGDTLPKRIISKITETFIHDMCDLYPSLNVLDEVSRAMSRNAFTKTSDKQKYVTDWLDRGIKFQAEERSPPSSEPRSGTREKILKYKAEVDSAKG